MKKIRTYIIGSILLCAVIIFFDKFIPYRHGYRITPYTWEEIWERKWFYIAAVLFMVLMAHYIEKNEKKQNKK
ncbi:MAG: hypothetical protein FWC39_11845 [Bacteroidetes bacterium]|nr:hypothetical protein [Bacteroidota bacterium]